MNITDPKSSTEQTIARNFNISILIAFVNCCIHLMYTHDESSPKAKGKKMKNFETNLSKFVVVCCHVCTNYSLVFYF